MLLLLSSRFSAHLIDDPRACQMPDAALEVYSSFDGLGLSKPGWPHVGLLDLASWSMSEGYRMIQVVRGGC